MSRSHENVTWQCNACTFINEGSLNGCEMCGTTRPDSPQDSKRAKGDAPLSAEEQALKLPFEAVSKLWDSKQYVYWDKSAVAYKAAREHFGLDMSRRFVGKYLRHTLCIMLTQDKVERKYDRDFESVLRDGTEMCLEALRQGGVDLIEPLMMMLDHGAKLYNSVATAPVGPRLLQEMTGAFQQLEEELLAARGAFLGIFVCGMMRRGDALAVSGAAQRQRHGKRGGAACALVRLGDLGGEAHAATCKLIAEFAGITHGVALKQLRVAAEVLRRRTTMRRSEDLAEEDDDEEELGDWGAASPREVVQTLSELVGCFDFDEAAGVLQVDGDDWGGVDAREAVQALEEHFGFSGGEKMLRRWQLRQRAEAEHAD